ncbi:MAG: motility associated factor glycosyltransferase family protein [Campylobacterales bacterium]|nr:motility associated factor glycosyltransferase family protein [Campylobacterales bacterium]
MIDYYSKNLEALEKVDLELAKKLKQIKENVDFDIYQGKDPIDINILNLKTQQTIYENPAVDIENLVKEYDEKYRLYPMLFFYGIGNGIFYKALMGNDVHKRVVIIEPNLEVIYIALNFVDLSKEIEDNRIFIKYSDDFTYGFAFDVVINKDFKVYAKLYDLKILHEYYINNHSEDIKRVNQLFSKAIAQMVYSLGNCAIDSLMGIEHHLHNIPDMLKGYKFQELIKKKNSNIAVITSTGPSLDKQIPLLKQIQDYVTIITPDATLAYLEKCGIKADIVTSLERTEGDVSSMLGAPSANYSKDVIFCVASVLHPTSIEAIKGQKCIVMRPFGYTQYFEKLNKFGFHGIGMSVSNMAHELAHVMGFEKCVLIGQDLAYGEDGKSHSKGNIYGEDQLEYAVTDSYVEKYGGNGEIRTSINWLLFRNYFEKYIEDSKNFMTTYNCTEGGARINGAVEMPFCEFIEQFIDKSKPKKAIKLKYSTENEYKKNLKIAVDYVEKWIQLGQKYQNRVEKLFLKLAKEFEILEKLNKQNKLEKINFEKLVKLTDDISAVKKLFNDEKFTKLYIDVVQSYIAHQEFELAKLVVLDPKDDIHKKAKLVDWIMKHKFWFFSLAGGMNAVLEIVKRNHEKLIKEYESIS